MKTNDVFRRILRIEGINAGQFAERTGITPSSLSRCIHNLNSAPSVAVLKRVIRHFPQYADEYTAAFIRDLFEANAMNTAVLDRLLSRHPELPELVVGDLEAILRSGNTEINRAAQSVLENLACLAKRNEARAITA